MGIDIESTRTKFPITRHKTFLNHSAYSPLSQPAVDAMRRYTDDLLRFEIDESQYPLGKAEFAQLIHASEPEIALVSNTSTGLNLVAHMIHHPAKTNVVTTDMEYPSVVYPWRQPRLGLDVRYAENQNGQIPLDGVAKLVDDHTVAVAVSHVEYVNGFRHDLKALADLAHQHGAYLVVDAIQSLGAMPVDVQRDDVDFLTASCYKWMLGPAGAGYLYVRKNLVQQFTPPLLGWASVNPDVFDTVDFWDIRGLQLADTASRFEIGSPSFISYIGAAASLRLLLSTGIDTISHRILTLTRRLLDALRSAGHQPTTPDDDACRSGIVHFLDPHAQEKADKLRAKGIIVSARSNGLRVAPHFYNTEDEIDRFIAELTAL